MRMKNILIWGIALVVLYNIFNDSQQTQTTTANRGSDSSAGTQKNQVPRKDPKGIWPYLKEGNSASSATEDLMRRNYYVVFDGSGSMEDSGCSDGQQKAVVAKKALMEFAGTVPATANLGLLVFDGNGINERVPLGLNNREAFNRAVQGVRPSSGTPLASAIRRAYEKLTQQGNQQLGYGEYHLIVVTDGEASGGEEPNQVVNDLLAFSPVVLHTLGFCISERHSLNQPGRVVYKAANDFNALRQGLSEVLAESEGFTITTFDAK